MQNLSQQSVEFEREGSPHLEWYRKRLEDELIQIPKL